MAKFEVVSRAGAAGTPLPQRKTKFSAGYDFVAAEDTLIHPYTIMKDIMWDWGYDTNKTASDVMTLDELAHMTSQTKARPTLVPTGIKCKMEIDEYLELSIRSSSPLKHWLLLANGVGIIDRDYYDNKDNEGEIFFQVINLSPYTIKLKKGDCIGQGIIKKYGIAEDDVATGMRIGGFGSTNA